MHLSTWPVAEESLISEDLDAAMELTQRIVELGRSARSEAKVKIRQPLSRALVPSAAYAQLTDELRQEIAAELNVERIESFASAGDLVDYSAKGNFRRLGKRFGKQTPPLVAQAIADADAAALNDQLREHGKAIVQVPEVGEVEVGPDEVLLSERPREGWSVINDQGETIALDLELTPRTGPGRAGPGSDPADPGDPEEHRARGLGPDHPALVGGGGDGRGAAGPWRAGGR